MPQAASMQSLPEQVKHRLQAGEASSYLHRLDCAQREFRKYRRRFSLSNRFALPFWRLRISGGSTFPAARRCDGSVRMIKRGSADDQIDHRRGRARR